MSARFFAFARRRDAAGGGRMKAITIRPQVPSKEETSMTTTTNTRSNHVKPSLALLAATLVTLAACGNDPEELDDAPVGVIDDAPQFVMTNLDQFPNVAVRCYGGNGIYTTTREYGDAITIIVADPECADGNPIPEGK